jgi:outer membrane protein OmpA-like peptidoglycan-associated protein
MRTFLIIAFVLLYASTYSQTNVDKTVTNTVNNRTNSDAGKAVNQGVDAVENGFKSLFKKKSKNQSQQSTTGQNSTSSGSNAKSSTSTTDAAQSLQSFTQYDFVPGETILFYDDFSQDAIGDFPALWTTNQSGEVNTLNIAPGKWFNLNSYEGYWLYLKEINLPKNFIMEFDIVPKKGGGRIAIGIQLFSDDKFNELSNPFDYDHHNSTLSIQIEKDDSWETYGAKYGMPNRIPANSTKNVVEEEKVNHVIIWVQDRRVRIYHKGAKVLDSPTNLYEDSKFNRLGFCLWRGASCASWISNIKITTAAPDTRSKLLTEGKLVTYGIYFDVNKDVVKPESYGTLKDIAQVLQENPTVRVKIVGHTDSDGGNALNLDLSKRRGAAVKNELVKTFGIDASRLESDGMGATQPIAPNDTPANKAKNRRVEFIKL